MKNRSIILTCPWCWWWDALRKVASGKFLASFALAKRQTRSTPVRVRIRQEGGEPRFDSHHKIKKDRILTYLVVLVVGVEPTQGCP